SGIGVDPAWHPTDGRIFYQTGGWNIAAISADGGDPKSIVTGPEPEFTPSWSRDGRYLLFVRFTPENKGDVWVLEPSAAQPKPFFTSSFFETRLEVSPDGKYIAYVSDETSRWEVFIRSFPSGEGKKQVSFGGGTSPRWNPRGGEI